MRFNNKGCHPIRWARYNLEAFMAKTNYIQVGVYKGCHNLTLIISDDDADAHSFQEARNINIDFELLSGGGCHFICEVKFNVIVL